ncbi:hypothetical protein AVEN_166236-1 [Araneus ventricosus]|uniref:Uncharacterized protein n=1 Tax=Araneus ventricosus TaxID=182803 RepID=A0A4Y2FQS1_ARAVE|nr:hypothetical protein AVEN_166236-1 [Araneus ventricosus]
MASKPDPSTEASMAKTLNVSQQVIRRKRPWPLYKFLRKNRWRKFITTDDAWIYLPNTNAKSKVQYLSRDQNRRDLTTSTTVTHPKGVMGICSNGVTKPRLYPNGDVVSHQDSAPSHASRVTQKFLTDQQVQFLRPEQWMPDSPDAAPCDYFLWGDLKNKLNERRISTGGTFKRLLEKR